MVISNGNSHPSMIEKEVITMRTMLDYLPKYYNKSPQVGNTNNSKSSIVYNLIRQEAIEITKVNDITDGKDSILNQFYIEDATWGLAHWERIYGLVTDESKSHEERRSVVKSKLRGIGTVTAALIKQVAESYRHGEVKVEEIPREHRIVITFIGELGIPKNLEDIQQVLAEITPAHLGINYIFTYMTWNDLDSYMLAWNELESKNLTWDQFKIYRE
ncbi:putative phage tail protein [Chengkuizengella sp. SCS-71B]|uniref:putative phage tail protein n=1 Tax=Chengkuizengella sp. SCS-71B TaxID=3115290 RepID=UPI0032C22097